MVSSQELAAIWLTFTGAAVATLWLGLTVGRLIRPSRPTAEKLRPYECGEEPIGTSRVQYDVRIYVAALVFVIFDVEVALLFPTGMFLGKVNNFRAARLESVLGTPHREAQRLGTAKIVDQWDGPRGGQSLPGVSATVGSAVADKPVVGFPEQMISLATGTTGRGAPVDAPAAGQLAHGVRGEVVDRLAWTIALELAVFFLILFVAYAYLWACGDLDWTRPSGALGKAEGLK